MNQSFSRIPLKSIIPTCLALAVLPAAKAHALTLSPSDINQVYTTAATKYSTYFSSISTANLNALRTGNPSIFPTNSSKEGAWSVASASDWRSGFAAGVLWEAYGNSVTAANPTGNVTLKNDAEVLTFGNRNNVATGDHDVGFRTLSSYVQGSRYVGNSFVYTYLAPNGNTTTDQSYLARIDSAAEHLASRYIPSVGATRSWDKDNTATTVEVIVDNMMNLQILFEARDRGDTFTSSGLTLEQIAINHARTTFNDFVRSDGSSVHEVVFANDGFGAILYKQSVQGDTAFGQWNPALPAAGQPYATTGTWSRGESWLISGFTMMSNNVTAAADKQEFLHDAQVVANYWVTRTLQSVVAGTGYVPPADFDGALNPAGNGGPVPNDLNHKDSSAGAIAADGLLKLSAITTDFSLKQQYWNVAVGTLDELLSSTYLSTSTSQPALLMHAAQQFSTGGENSSFPYADYYLLDALKTYQSLAPRAGDATLDGIVNISDLNLAAANWQQSVAPFALGDFNGDGIINIADLNIIAANWQAGAGAGSNSESLAALTTTPEPTSLALLTLALAPLLTRRSHNRVNARQHT